LNIAKSSYDLGQSNMTTAFAGVQDEISAGRTVAKVDMSEVMKAHPELRMRKAESDADVPRMKDWYSGSGEGRGRGATLDNNPTGQVVPSSGTGATDTIAAVFSGSRRRPELACARLSSDGR
jgi:hypothetical protein